MKVIGVLVEVCIWAVMLVLAATVSAIMIVAGAFG